MLSLYRRENLLVGEIYRSPQCLWDLGQQQGAFTQGYCFLTLNNGPAVQISQRERWCCSYPAPPEICH